MNFTTCKLSLNNPDFKKKNIWENEIWGLRLQKLKANLKRLQTIWFHLCNSLQWQSYRDGEQIGGWLPGFRDGNHGGKQGEDDMGIFNTICVTVNILLINL